MFPKFDIAVIDECQDITKLYYSYVCKILRDHEEVHGKRPQLMMVGDENQCIYKFNGSDSR